ncbi:MAG: hypothetical protein FRX49_06719 [Trebouxia sp. A1-2]|nr:MAG: hypothetical protein FRX49_06719 [Trebouxia sp. A1-2]
MTHEVTLRRPTLQLRCRAGLTLPAAVPALGTGGFSDWTLSSLPFLLLLRLTDTLIPVVMQQNELSQSSGGFCDLIESSLAMRASICLASSSLTRSCHTAFWSLGFEGFSPANRVKLWGCKGSAADPSRGLKASAPCILPPAFEEPQNSGQMPAAATGTRHADTARHMGQRGRSAAGKCPRQVLQSRTCARPHSFQYISLHPHSFFLSSSISLQPLHQKVAPERLQGGAAG